MFFDRLASDSCHNPDTMRNTHNINPRAAFPLGEPFTMVGILGGNPKGEFTPLLERDGLAIVRGVIGWHCAVRIDTVFLAFFKSLFSEIIGVIVCLGHGRVALGKERTSIRDGWPFVNALRSSADQGAGHKENAENRDSKLHAKQFWMAMKMNVVGAGWRLRLPDCRRLLNVFRGPHYFVLYKLNVLRYIALSVDELINQFGQFRNPELTLIVISTIRISPGL